MVPMTMLPQGRPLTRVDLEATPDDGHRYELIDGTLIVTPSPGVQHQRIVGNLYQALRQACPEDLEVMLAPLDVTVSESTVLQPDLLVARRDALTGHRMTGVPVLAVEVLSPSTRLVDLNLKRAAHELAGTGAYWVVDPDGPVLVTWQLRDGAYAEADRAAGEETFIAREPFFIEIVAADLAR